MIFQTINSLKKSLSFLLLLGLLSPSAGFAHEAPAPISQVQENGDTVFRITPGMRKTWYWLVAAYGLEATAFLGLMRELKPEQTAKEIFQATDTLTPEMRATIDTVIEKCGIDPKTILVFDSKSPLVAPALAVGGNLIVINVASFNTYTLEEIEFVISHELSHLQSMDNTKISLVAAAAPFIAHFGLQAWDALVTNAIKRIKGHVEPLSITDTALTKINNANHWMSTFCLTTCFVGWKLVNAYSCRKEREADFFAITHLKSSKGGCAFFTRLQEQQKPLRNLSLLHRYTIDENGDNLGDHLHPLLSERIAYCKEWADIV